jgi:hypothetical protein
MRAGDSSIGYPRPASLTSEQADQMQYDAMLGPSPGGGQTGQALSPMTQCAHGGWTEQVQRAFREYKPWGLSGHVSRIWNTRNAGGTANIPATTCSNTCEGKGSTLKGRGRKGNGGRNAQHQGVFDRGPDVTNDLRFPGDLHEVEGQSSRQFPYRTNL